MTGLPPGVQESIAGFHTRHPRSSLGALISASPRVLVIAISGELGNDLAADFQSTLRLLLPAALSRGGLILDLVGLSYISSSGIGAITSLLVESHRLKLTFELARVTGKVKDVIDLLGFSSFLTFIEGYEVEK